MQTQPAVSGESTSQGACVMSQVPAEQNSGAHSSARHTGTAQSRLAQAHALLAASLQCCAWLRGYWVWSHVLVPWALTTESAPVADIYIF